MHPTETYFSSAVNYDDSLWRAAAECSVDTSYWDIFGQQHHITREGLQTLLQAIGWNTASFEILEQQRRQRFLDRVQSVLSATCVVSQAEKYVPFFISSAASGPVGYQIELEDGTSLSGSLDLSQLAPFELVAFEDQRWSGLQLHLPAETPLGYHTLSLSLGGQALGQTHLIVCPDRAYLPPNLAAGGRTAGFNVALYGLRSSRNWGCGDFSDLHPLLDWAARDAGFSFVGLNPLHALHNRVPYNTSPYLPLSMYYKNLIYIDIEAVPEADTSACVRAFLSSSRLQQELRRLRDAEFIHYSAIDRLKRRFLKLLYREFVQRAASQPQRLQAFADFCAREADLLDNFALYCALDETLHKQDRSRWTWRDWPPAYQTPHSAESHSFAAGHPRLIRFYKYIQFVIEEQLQAAQRHAAEAGLSIGLYHDLAVATDNCGSDLWANGDHYIAGCRVGAPPDGFSPQGQDWGFPPPNKEVHRSTGYRLYRESIRKIVRFGGALRIDHVMRLYRLFWVPAGLGPGQGTYVRDYALDLMRVLALESVRSKNIIIGEDLGTVTDEMRDLFARFGILSYRLFYFEKNFQSGDFKDSWEYPRQALVSSTTHDLPTLAGFWSSRDIEARKNAGLADEAGYRHQLAERQREKQSMLDILHAENLLPAGYPASASALNQLDGPLHNAIVGFLAQVPSLLLLLNQEDFTKETDQQNLPGSTAEYPNWQRKMRVPVDQLSSPDAKPYTEMFRHHLKRTVRT